MLDKIFKSLGKFLPLKWRWVLNHEGFKRYFANTGWMFGGQIFSLGASFFVGAWIARYLGPEDFGLMNYVISFVGLFGFLAGFGVDSILNRELVKFPEKKDQLLGTSFWMKLIGGGLVIIVVNIISFLNNSDLLTRSLILIFSSTYVFQSFSVISTFFQAQVISKKIVKTQIIGNLISVAIKILFISLNLGVIWIMFIYFLDSVFLALGYIFIYYKKERVFLKIKIEKRVLFLLLRDSIPLMFSVIALTIYNKIDQVIIKKMLDDGAVGVYAVAVKISEVWYFIPGLICTSLFPAIINAKKTNVEVYRQRLKNLYALLVYMGLIVSTVIFFLSEPLINIMFGSAYLASVAISKIYAWSGLAVFLMTGFWTYLLNENYTKIYLGATIIGATTNILLNIIFIPRYGVIGAAYATLISYALPPLFLILFTKTRGQFFLACQSVIRK